MKIFLNILHSSLKSLPNFNTCGCSLDQKYSEGGYSIPMPLLILLGLCSIWLLAQGTQVLTARWV